MANTLITPSIIAKEALFHLENNIIMGDKVHRQYKNEFVKIGDSLTIRRPVKFVVSDGAVRVNQDVTEPTTSIVINSRKHVSWNFSSQDLTLTVDEYSERYIKPAAIVLANQIDLDLCQEGAEEFYNIVQKSAVPSYDFEVLTQVGRRMDDLSVPDDGNRCGILNPEARWSFANQIGGTGSGGVFNADIVHEMVRKGYLGQLANFDLYGDQNIRSHTVGTHTGTPLVTTALPTDGSTTLNFDGMVGNQTAALRKGDILTLAGVNAVNPVSRQDTGVLAEFVVTADVDTTAGAGAATLFPAFQSTGAFQNITALPADNAAITIRTGASAAVKPQNLFFHRNALALVTVPLELPDSATFKARMDWRGYSIRVVKDYDIDSDEEIIRLDILYGVKAIYPDLGVRMSTVNA